MTFPLLWVGGLVTTYQAGMAVPDWPNTYGYNLFLYPWQTWVFGPWDLFIEHGHRLLGATVGLLSIALVVALFVWEPRRPVRALGVVALLAVISQGVLGGVRVIEDERQLAKIHGCFGPAVFALLVSLATVTSRAWRKGQGRTVAADAGKLRRLAILTAGLAYVQLVLGAQLRHVSPTAPPGEFQAAVVFHLLLAAALAVHVGLLAARIARRHRDLPRLVRPASLLVVLLTAQIALGCAVWVLNYGWPAFLTETRWTAGHLTIAQSPTQANVTTAHVAGGSLVLVTAVALALRCWRLLEPAPRVRHAAQAALVVGGAR